MDLGSDEEFGWIGNEDLTAEGLDQVYAEIENGEPGSPHKPDGEETEGEMVEEVNSEGSEEDELRDLIEQALEHQEYCENHDYSAI